MPYTVTSPLKVENPSGQGEIQINNLSNNINLKAPNTLSSNYDFILPSIAGTNGQILALNGTGGTVWQNNTISSIDNVSATSTVTYTNTNVTTPLVVNSMSVTPPAGTYICIFNTSGQIPSDVVLNYGVYVNGSLEPSSGRFSRDGAPFFSTRFLLNLTTSCIVTVNGVDVVDVRAFLDTAGSYSLFTRLLFLLKIG